MPAVVEVDTSPLTGVSEDSENTREENSPPEVSVIEIVTSLARRKGFIAKVTGAALLVGLAISLLLPVRYTATTKIMTPQPTPSAANLLTGQFARIGADPLAALGGASGLGLKNPNDIYIALLSSRPIADAIIARFDLAKEYRAKNMTAARKALATNTLTMSEKSGLIEISATDTDKNRAAQIANAYTEGLRTLTRTLAVTEASQRRGFYEEQLKRAKDDLVSAEFTLQQIEQKKGVVLPDAQAKAVIAGLAEIQAKASAKQVELEALRSYSTERNPDVQMAEREVSSLRAEAERIQQSAHSPHSADLGLQDMAGASLEYLNAQHELEYRQILFDMLLKQYDAARLDESKDAAIVQVVEPAIPPDLKSWPPRATIILLLTVLGFVLACVFALMAEIIAHRPAAVRAIAGLRAALMS
jgi:tyrosine-protein kinase Etk/Wzc